MIQIMLLETLHWHQWEENLALFSQEDGNGRKAIQIFWKFAHFFFILIQ